MSSSRYKFLVDENVRRELYRFLQGQGYDVKLASKGSSDGALAKVSLEERRVFVTNDAGFTEYTKDEIFSVVWLRILQSDLGGLLNAFRILLKDSLQFKGNFVVLWPGKFDVFPLGEVIDYKNL